MTTYRVKCYVNAVATAIHGQKLALVASEYFAKRRDANEYANDMKGPYTFIEVTKVVTRETTLQVWDATR